MNEQLLHRTRWGGRAARYRRNPGKALRIADPISGTHEEFGQDLIYEAWLIHRFNPIVSEIKVGHVHLANADLSPNCLNYIQLDVVFANGTRLLESISQYPASTKRIGLVKAAAKQIGASWRTQCRADVRASLGYVTNLRNLRQLMQIHMEVRRFPELHAVVTATDAVTRADLESMLANCDPDTLDAGLGFLLQAGVIEMDIKEKAFGPTTLIKRK